MIPFKATIKEDLNRPYNVTLTEGQISTILYVMEGYVQGNDDYDGQFKTDVKNISQVHAGPRKSTQLHA